MTYMPPKMAALAEDFAFVDRSERAEMLIEFADRFSDVPERIATRPFDEDHKVIRCESDASIWWEDLPDGTFKYCFPVETPEGLSAKAWAVIMDETLSGEPLEVVAATSPEAVFTFYGKDLSMGKGQGLMGMTDMVTLAAKRKLTAARASA